MTRLGEYSRKNDVSDSRNLVYFKCHVKKNFLVVISNVTFTEKKFYAIKSN